MWAPLVFILQIWSSGGLRVGHIVPGVPFFRVAVFSCGLEMSIFHPGSLRIRRVPDISPGRNYDCPS